MNRHLNSLKSHLHRAKLLMSCNHIRAARLPILRVAPPPSFAKPLHISTPTLVISIRDDLPWNCVSRGTCRNTKVVASHRVSHHTYALNLNAQCAGGSDPLQLWDSRGKRSKTQCGRGESLPHLELPHMGLHLAIRQLRQQPAAFLVPWHVRVRSQGLGFVLVNSVRCPSCRPGGRAGQPGWGAFAARPRGLHQSPCTSFCLFSGPLLD